MHIIDASSIDRLWVQSIAAIAKHGIKISGIQEIPNLIMTLTGDFSAPGVFDAKFRGIFGDERIDYASSVTFVEPSRSKITGAYQYVQNNPAAKWTESYWGRMIAYDGQINQIEAAIKKLQNGKNTKMISISVYSPTADHKKVMGGVPCMTALDIKPRNGRIDATAMFRSMRLTKSGYADMSALCRLLQYLCRRTSMTPSSLTLIATSGHIFYSGEEWDKTKALLRFMRDQYRGSDA